MLACELAGELLFDYGRLADELDGVLGIELTECEQCTGHRRLGGKVPTHGVQRDARQLRLPSLLPAACRRNSRTRRRHDADASSPDSAGTSGLRWRAPSCACYARASFAWRYVSSGRPLSVHTW